MGISMAHPYSRKNALDSLSDIDPGHPVPEVAALLTDERNDELLGYLQAEAFTHVFTGDVDSTPSDFFAGLERELRKAPAYHLWVDIPLCRYRCHFCQFPTLVTSSRSETADATARRWVDANIKEARAWVEAVPALRTTPVGEFCLFGGTPSVLPPGEIERLVGFYRETFAIDEQTSMRAEGSPDSLSEEILQALRASGFTALAYGIQSLDDRLLAIANRRHTGEQALQVREAAERSGFDRVDGDLVWGLPGQTVAGFLDDVDRMIAAEFSTIVAIKLHLRSFHEVESAIGHVSPAPWEDPRVREQLERRGYPWPSLGRQLQMREGAVERLAAAGYYEHPTTYFPRREVGPELWRSLNLDQDQQVPQVGIGLGTYSWCGDAEANVVAAPAHYLKAVEQGEIPFENVTAVSAEHREVRAVQMALSTCQPLREDIHRSRFPGSSLLSGRWGEKFDSLAGRGLMRVDREAGSIALTEEGATLVEAVINTQLGR
ncbi:radical SAM protein [Streptomyces albus]|uniref:radical SAM protein n=1 Tax=Streptomyces albus TaxID=1888 RepID=UPI0024ADEFD2|nr:radical SAM protein [Streptomyces albus]MDI6409704.1 radical SAM protein [Streptomyces albus]